MMIILFAEGVWLREISSAVWFWVASSRVEFADTGVWRVGSEAGRDVSPSRSPSLPPFPAASSLPPFLPPLPPVFLPSSSSLLPLPLPCGRSIFLSSSPPTGSTSNGEWGKGREDQAEETCEEGSWW